MSERDLFIAALQITDLAERGSAVSSGGYNCQQRNLVDEPRDLFGLDLSAVELPRRHHQVS